MDFFCGGINDKYGIIGERDIFYNGVFENIIVVVFVVIVCSNYTVNDVVEIFIFGDCYVVVRVGEDWFVDVAMNSDRDCGRFLKGIVRSCY